MIHVSVKDRYSQRTYVFGREVIVIGSAPDADLVLDKDGVAAGHIRVIERDDGDVVVEDMRSQDPRPRVVEPDAIIRIAGIDLRITRQALVPEDISDDAEHQLLAEIRKRPDDPAPRTVYADWLEQHGHAARAEFLRTQLAAGGAREPDDPAFTAAAARLAELAPTVGDGWRARVAMALIEQCPSAPSPHAWQRRRQEQLGMELVCPMRWDKLAPTDREDVRSCGACNRTVTYCTSVGQAQVIAQDGGCVAVDVGVARSEWDLVPPPMVGRPSPPLSRYGRAK